MTDLTGARCVGRSWLFDSTDIRDHYEARAICAACPAVEACREEARQILTATATVAHYGLTGTWAGQLFGRVGRPRPNTEKAGV